MIYYSHIHLHISFIGVVLYGGRSIANFEKYLLILQIKALRIIIKHNYLESE